MYGKPMKFLLINPPMDYEILKKEFSFEAYLPPLGLLYIARTLEKKGHDVRLIDFVAEQFTEEKLKKEVEKVDIICITVPSQVATSVVKISELIKQQYHDKMVIIGGPHCTIQGRETLNEISADIAVIGDGEETIINIVKTLEDKQDLSGVHGIFYRDNEIIKKGLPAKEIENLDSIDFPARHLIKKYTYGKKTISGVTYFARGKITSIITTRGCPFNCRFCISKAIFERCRLRSVENVVQELEEISKTTTLFLRLMIIF